MARVCHLVGPGGFEPPTSTMSRVIGRTKTRVDTLEFVRPKGSLTQADGLELCRVFIRGLSGLPSVLPQPSPAELWLRRPWLYVA